MKSNIDIFIHLLIFEGLSSRAQGTSNRIDLALDPKDSSCLDPEVSGTLLGLPRWFSVTARAIPGDVQGPGGATV